MNRLGPSLLLIVILTVIMLLWLYAMLHVVEVQQQLLRSMHAQERLL